jgi:anti-sigma B factor antagonist
VGIKISTRKRDGIVIIDMVGELRLGEGTGVLRDVIRDVVAQGDKKILVNLAVVRHMDSAGIGELVTCFTSVRNQGGHLKLMNLNKNVHNILQITKLVTVFEVVDDENTAVKSFQ